jgi:hypothetical protein
MTDLLVGEFLKFFRSIAVLALPSADQVAWLMSLEVEVDCCDELALEFGDGYLLVAQFVDRGFLGDAARLAVSRLSELLNEISGPENERLWRTEALEVAPEWYEVRRLARDVLFAY